MHQRGRDGGLTPIDFELPEAPEVWMGGGAPLRNSPGLPALSAHVAERRDGGGRPRAEARDGRSCRARPSRRDDDRAHDQRQPRPDARRGVLPRDAEDLGPDLHGQRAGAPTGRPAGSIGWAGLGNLYYWIDRKNGVAGFWASQFFPFMGPAAFDGFAAFETALYEALGRRSSGSARSAEQCAVAVGRRRRRQAPPSSGGRRGSSREPRARPDTLALCEGGVR